MLNQSRVIKGFRICVFTDYFCDIHCCEYHNDLLIMQFKWPIKITIIFLFKKYSNCSYAASFYVCILDYRISIFWNCLQVLIKSHFVEDLICLSVEFEQPYFWPSMVLRTIWGKIAKLLAFQCLSIIYIRTYVSVACFSPGEQLPRGRGHPNKSWRIAIRELT